MNNSNDQILEQLGKLGSADGAASAAQATVKQPAVDLSSVEKKDQWCFLLVDLIYNLNQSFRDVYYWEGVKTEKDSCREIVRILHLLQEIPNDDGTVRISLRGTPSTKISEKADYVIRLGEFTVDVAAISSVTKRMGIRLKHFEGRLIKSFEQFASLGINTVFIKIPDESGESLEAMRISLRIISCYNQAVENDSAIKYVKNHENLTLQPIRDEFDQPDPNLTQLAALNNLSAEDMGQMVQKVSALMKRPEFAQSGIQSVSVYQTIFHIKSLIEKLLRPPIELCSQTASHADKSRMPANRGGSGSGQGITGSAGAHQFGSSDPAAGPGSATYTDTDHADDDQGGGTVAPGNIPTTGTDPAVKKAEIARFVNESYGNSIGSAKQAIEIIYGSDYKQLDTIGLENRLHQIVELLDVIESSGGSEPIVEEVRERVQAGLSQVPREFLDDLVVQDDLIKIWDGDEEKILGKANNSLADIIDTSKKRSAARRKIRGVLSPEAHISDQDYEQLAEVFDISPQESQEIIKHFKGCFDSHNNFQRIFFEKKVPDFAGYPKRIFEILWEFLRATPRRKDRVPFLNSLQLLVSEIGQPKQALKDLLSDFVLNPTEISYPDRNALMLASQLVRTYHKEIIMDIEITPEELLLVQVGLDHSVVRYAAWKLNGEQKKFIEKIATIRKKLLTSLGMASSDDPDPVMSVRFLLALEREAHIFLALVGGDMAAAVIRGALNVYGNPASQIYLLKESRQYTPNLLQHLAVLIRGLGRVGQPADFALLDNIKNRQEVFIGLSEEPHHAAQVQRTLGWIEAAKKEITGMTNDE